MVRGLSILLLILGTCGCSDPRQPVPPVAEAENDNPLQHLEQQLRRAEDTMQQQQQQIQGLQHEIQRISGEGELRE